MEESWISIFHNKILWFTLLSWSIAQGIKITRGLLKEKKFNFYWLLKTGGMPSAHSAAVVTLAFSVGKEVGFTSPDFALATMLALITMFDAQTWRRSIGAQARVLNKIIEDIQKRKKVEEHKLKELVGHTPVEVLVGALIGLGVGVLFY